MLPFRQSSLVQQPDGEIIRAVVDSATAYDEYSGIQFDLGLLGLKVAQEGQGSKDPHNPLPQISLPGIWRLRRACRVVAFAKHFVQIRLYPVVLLQLSSKPLVIPPVNNGV